MSTWTHVAGVVRVDAIRMGMTTEVNWDDIFVRSACTAIRSILKEDLGRMMHEP